MRDWTLTRLRPFFVSGNYIVFPVLRTSAHRFESTGRLYQLLSQSSSARHWLISLGRWFKLCITMKYSSISRVVWLSTLLSFLSEKVRHSSGKLVWVQRCSVVFRTGWSWSQILSESLPIYRCPILCSNYYVLSWPQQHCCYESFCWTLHISKVSIGHLSQRVLPWTERPKELCRIILAQKALVKKTSNRSLKKKFSLGIRGLH